MRRLIAFALAMLAAAVAVPAADASAPIVPRVVVDAQHGTACVVEDVGDDAGGAACVQLYDPDCIVLLVHETIAGPVAVCLVPAP